MYVHMYVYICYDCLYLYMYVTVLYISGTYVCMYVCAGTTTTTCEHGMYVLAILLGLGRQPTRLQGALYRGVGLPLRRLERPPTYECMHECMYVCTM